MQYLILSADFYSVQDPNTGRTSEGVTCWYLNSYREDTSEAFGFKPTKVGITLEQFKELKKNPLPAMYELDFASRPGAQGKATLVVVGQKFIKPVEIFKK